MLQLYFRKRNDARSELIVKALSYNDEEEEVLLSFATQAVFEAFCLLELREALCFLFRHSQTITVTSELLFTLMESSRLKALRTILKHYE